MRSALASFWSATETHGQTPHFTSLIKARQKLSWKALQAIFVNVVKYAIELDTKAETFHGHNVYAIDGSKYQLPISKELVESFDTGAGVFPIENRGYYPHCLVVTVFDIFRKIPICRIVDNINSSERALAQMLIKDIPESGILLFDRGYPGYEFINTLNNNYKGSFIIRCPMSSTFSSVQEFIASAQSDANIILEPKREQKASNENKPIKVRAVRIKQGKNEYVLLTNLMDKSDYPPQELAALYKGRWMIEIFNRDEKHSVVIEQFHSSSRNGILQEFYASLIVMVFAQIFNVLAKNDLGTKRNVQNKSAIVVVAVNAYIFSMDNLAIAIKKLNEIIRTLSRIPYYQPKKKRGPYPRISKQPDNQWVNGRKQRYEAFLVCKA